MLSIATLCKKKPNISGLFLQTFLQRNYCFIGNPREGRGGRRERNAPSNEKQKPAELPASSDNDKPLEKIANTLLESLLLKSSPYFGFFLIAWTLFATFAGYQSRDWEETEGVIEKLDGFRFGNYFIGRILYSYRDPFVDEREISKFGLEDHLVYQGDTYAVSAPFKLIFIEWNENLQQGNKIPVFYDKSIRNRSTLHKGVHSPFSNAFAATLGAAIFFLPMISVML